MVRASLEAAFMELTADSVEYRADSGSRPLPPGQAASEQPFPQQVNSGQYSHEGQS